MTDDLVKRLRADDADNGMAMGLSGEAADRIEAQAAEIEWLNRLIEAMATALDNTGNRGTAKQLRARAALGDTQ